MFFFDPTYILVIIGIVICIAASINVNNVYNKYSKVKSARQVTAADVAEQILRRAGITDVKVEMTGGQLTDHFDPLKKSVRLSESTYNSTSVAAIGVAAHECGHVIQYYRSYFLIRLRNLFVPVANIGSMLSWPIILFGVLFGIGYLVNIGIILFTGVLIFQIVTLPVELNASSRALRILKENGILVGEECGLAKKVLRAAALTYVAGAITTALQLLRLLLLFGRRRNK